MLELSVTRAVGTWSAAAPLGSVTFGLPFLAWGLLAASIPVVIHLVMRERARHEVFPALRFLVASHTSATRAQWLRHLLLLASRIAAIALAVGLLGRVGCTQEEGRPVASLTSAEPASVVLCIDNSASMGYRYQGQTRVQAAIDWARTLVEDHRQFGPGTQFSIVTGTPTAGLGVWREDTRGTIRLLDTIRPAAHNLGVAHLVGRACHLLASARHSRREIYVFNDLTESSWYDSLPSLPQSLSGLYVLDVGQEENRNAQLGWLQVPPHAVTAGSPVQVSLRVVAAELPCEAVLKVSIDGKPRGRQTTGVLPANSQADMAINLPALEPGAHWLSVELEPDDALSCDNVRFGWVVAGELPQVAVLGGSGSAVPDMIQAMIAPPALPASAQRYAVKRVALEDLLTLGTDGLTGIVLADVKSLNGLAWERLATYVKGGGLLIVVPGPALSPEDYRLGEAVLPGLPGPVVDCDPPLRPAISDLSHPYLTPFADVAIDSVNDRHAFKRLTLTRIAERTTVVFPFSDSSPALVEARPGKGRTVLMAFSPAPEWGQFGTQAAPMIVLLHRILETARPPLQNLAAFAAGRPGSRTAGDGSAPLLVRAVVGEAEATILPSPAKIYAFPTDSPGAYQAAEKSSPKSPILHYSVNVAEAESNRQRVDPNALKSRSERDLMEVLKPGDALTNRAGSGVGRVSWSVPLGSVLLLLILVESSFSNRFYRLGRR